MSPLAKYIPVFLGAYLAFKIGDMLIRGSWVYIDGSPQSLMFLVEMIFGLIVPFVMLLSPKVRNTPRLLFIAALMIVVLGVALNRVNVFLVAFQPPYATKTYFPAIGEFAVTVGLVSLLMLIYRIIVTYFPVISHPGEARAT